MFYITELRVCGSPPVRKMQIYGELFWAELEICRIFKYNRSKESVNMKDRIKEIPIIGKIGLQLYCKIMEYKTIPMFFPGSKKYWEDRYSVGGNSGAGSYNKLALFKAEVVNNFVAEHDVNSVIEFGCGDGNQLKLAEYPYYTGFDVSETAVLLCRKKFSSDENKRFRHLRDYNSETADLSLSLDVIYHLVEDFVYHEYMSTLFKSARKYVIIYSSNTTQNSLCQCAHVKHRKFTTWIKKNKPGWKLTEQVPNKYPYTGDFRKGSFAEFYIFEKAPVVVSKHSNKTARRPEIQPVT